MDEAHEVIDFSELVDLLRGIRRQMVEAMLDLEIDLGERRPQRLELAAAAESSINVCRRQDMRSGSWRPDELAKVRREAAGYRRTAQA